MTVATMLAGAAAPDLRFTFDDTEIDRLLNNRIDLESAIDAADEWDALVELYALYQRNELAIEAWLLTAPEACHA